MSTKTGKISADKTTLTFVLTKEEKSILRELAENSGMILSVYLRRIISDAITDKTVYESVRKSLTKLISNKTSFH